MGLRGPFKRKRHLTERGKLSYRPKPSYEVSWVIHNREIFMSEWGKHFGSMYEGSMVGKGAIVFALMGFIIARMQCRWIGEGRAKTVVEGTVRLNPQVLATIFGEPAEKIEDGIKVLTSPDPATNLPDEEGRRLVQIGPFDYRVVNAAHYQNRRDEAEQREKTRERVAQWRAAQNAKKTDSSTWNNECYHADSRTVLHWLNEKSGRHYRETDANLKFISARLGEPDVTLEGMKLMIERQCKRWKGTAQAEYLRPETLFGKTKFDSYYAAKEEPVYDENNKPNPRNLGVNISPEEQTKQVLAKQQRDESKRAAERDAHRAAELQHANGMAKQVAQTDKLPSAS